MVKSHQAAFRSTVAFIDANQRVGACMSDVAFGVGWDQSDQADYLLTFCEDISLALHGTDCKALRSVDPEENWTWSSAAAGQHRIPPSGLDPGAPRAP